MLTALFCLMLAGFAWMAVSAEWRSIPGAAVLLALLAGIAVVMGAIPLVQTAIPAL